MQKELTSFFEIPPLELLSTKKKKETEFELAFQTSNSQIHEPGVSVCLFLFRFLRLD